MGVSQEPLVVGCFSYWRGALYWKEARHFEGGLCDDPFKSSNSIGG